MDDYNEILYYIDISIKCNLSYRRLHERIKKSLNIEDISERYLKKLILEKMDSFLKELGSGITYVGNEYKIRIGSTFNYIDKSLKRIDHDNTISLIVCKKDNKLVLEYSSEPRIFSTTYVLM